ncbi:cation:dicarboxylate symporter family transporter [Kutzneria sp. 744]|uniref:cation:dicarboxylate symporter family transporter n=1 Tax=Kutzneria sp. (strain 744) TaxID=345341 RepID=UPI0003EEBDC8|nr:cation:dicarboxylase symporter family transporter [Kutzneria sp. 744]EWM16667.1 aerobic C4-dicarboxylate transport protein [Kutzneria sp. 744]
MRRLYVWVLTAIALGAVFGLAFPKQAAGSKWLADLFLDLVKVVTAPTIFLTVVVGIAGLGSLAKAGGLAARAIGYFMAMTAVALLLGLIVGNVLRPGDGLDIAADPNLAATTIKSAEATSTSISDFILGLVPSSFVGAFTGGQPIQVLVIAVLVATALSGLGQRAAPVVRALETLAQLMFQLIKVIMYVAPIGAFGGIAYTVGAFGGRVLGNLALLVVTFWVTCIVFVVVILGAVAKFAGFNIFRMIRYLSDEILIVVGTSSSETVLPRLMTKLENAGVSRSVVGMVVPAGYSFNLDGICVYLTLGALFIAQATGHAVSVPTQIGMVAFMLISSKGAAGVTGAGLITLTASLQAFNNPAIPVVGIALLVGVDRFMSEARSTINVISNGVATLVIARWQGALDRDRLREVLTHRRAGETTRLPSGAVSTVTDAA